MISLFKKEKIRRQEPLSRKEKIRLNRFADLIGRYILKIRAQAFSKDSKIEAEETAGKLQRVSNIIMNIYAWDYETVKLMSQMSNALTGSISEEKIKQLEDLNIRFRNHIRKG